MTRRFAREWAAVGAERVRERFGLERMVDDVDRLYRSLLAAMRVVHLLKVTGVAGAEQHLLRLLPALRERGVDARFVGLDVAGPDAERLYSRLAERGRPRRTTSAAPAT